MRHKGDKNSFKERRTAEIMQAYTTIMANYGGRVSVRTIYEMVAFSPASRFFIANDWAYRVVLNYERNEKYRGKDGKRARMYREIYDRVKHLQRMRPEIQLSEAVDIVISSPAPEMYMKTTQISRIINAERKRQGRERLRMMKERKGTYQF